MFTQKQKGLPEEDSPLWVEGEREKSNHLSKVILLTNEIEAVSSL